VTTDLISSFSFFWPFFFSGIFRVSKLHTSIDVLPWLLLNYHHKVRARR
jgi:hypothetical protein